MCFRGRPRFLGAEPDATTSVWKSVDLSDGRSDAWGRLEADKEAREGWRFVDWEAREGWRLVDWKFWDW